MMPWNKQRFLFLLLLCAALLVQNNSNVVRAAAEEDPDDKEEKLEEAEELEEVGGLFSWVFGGGSKAKATEAPAAEPSNDKSRDEVLSANATDAASNNTTYAKDASEDAAATNAAGSVSDEEEENDTDASGNATDSTDAEAGGSEDAAAGSDSGEEKEEEENEGEEVSEGGNSAESPGNSTPAAASADSSSEEQPAGDNTTDATGNDADSTDVTADEEKSEGEEASSAESPATAAAEEETVGDAGSEEETTVESAVVPPGNSTDSAGSDDHASTSTSHWQADSSADSFEEEEAMPDVEFDAEELAKEDLEEEEKESVEEYDSQDVHTLDEEEDPGFDSQDEEDLQEMEEEWAKVKQLDEMLVDTVGRTAGEEAADEEEEHEKTEEEIWEDHMLDCFADMATADKDKDNYMSDKEYDDFCNLYANRIFVSQNVLKRISATWRLEELFEELILEDRFGDAREQVNIYGVRFETMEALSHNQNGYLQKICSQTEHILREIGPKQAGHDDRSPEGCTLHKDHSNGGGTITYHGQKPDTNSTDKDDAEEEPEAVVPLAERDPVPITEVMATNSVIGAINSMFSLGGSGSDQPTAEAVEATFEEGTADDGAGRFLRFLHVATKSKEKKEKDDQVTINGSGNSIDDLEEGDENGNSTLTSGNVTKDDDDLVIDYENPLSGFLDTVSSFYFSGTSEENGEQVQEEEKEEQEEEEATDADKKGKRRRLRERGC